MQYQFWLYNPAASPAWSLLQSSAQVACNWTPSAVGPYLLSVTATDSGTGIALNQMLWDLVITAPLTAVSLSTNASSPLPPGMPVTLTATPTGGTNVQYQFWLYNPAATPAWSLEQDFSTTSNYQWIPLAKGPYMFVVNAQDGLTGVQVYTMVWFTVN